MLRLVAALLLAAACTALRADPATARYAGTQLQLALSELDGARAALQMNDYAMARQLAAQAQLDARLAWGMTESAVVRGAAIEVLRNAERLRWRGLTAAGVPAPLIRP